MATLCYLDSKKRPQHARCETNKRPENAKCLDPNSPHRLWHKFWDRDVGKLIFEIKFWQDTVNVLGGSRDGESHLTEELKHVQFHMLKDVPAPLCFYVHAAHKNDILQLEV